MRNLFYLILPAMLFIVSCSNNSTKGNPSDIQIAETLIYNHQDSFYTNPKETEEHLTAMLGQLSDSSAKGRITMFLGMARLFQGDNGGYEKHLSEVSKYCASHPDDHPLLGLYWNDCGIGQMMAGNRDSAIACYEKSRKELVLAQDTARACDVSVNLASLLREKGEMANAANVLQEAHVMAQGRSKRPATIRFAVDYTLGSIYSDMYSFGISDIYFKEAEQNIQYANLNDQYMFYSARGSRYFFDKKYSQASQDFSKSKDLATKLQNPVFVAIAESNIGEVLHNEGKDDEAMPLLLNAEKTIATSGAGDPRSSAYLNDLIASTMAHVGDIAEAKKRFLATDTAAIAQDPRYMMTHYERLADFYHITGDNGLAYDNIERARRYETEFRNKLFGEQMADAQQRYQRDKKVLTQRAEIDQQKAHVSNLTTMVVVIVVFAIIVIALILWSQSRKRQLLQLKYQRELTQLSLENIHNRLSPHFIMNVLGRELSMNNEGVTRLIKFIRQNLMLVERSVIPLSEELDFVDNYVELERKSLSPEFDYQCSVDPDIDIKAVSVPAMMVHVFVENAIKHGLRGQGGKVYLHIDVVKQNGKINITIDNNGSDNQSKTDGTHTGLKVVRQSIDLFNKQNREPITLNYGPEDNGVWHVSISIPFGYEYKETN